MAIKISYKIALGIILAVIFTLFSSLYYTGSKILFMGYNCIIFIIIGSLINYKKSYFSLFFFLFLLLGCWLKLILHLFLSYNFIEPIGEFSNSAAAWDRALVVLITAFTALLISHLIMKKINFRAFLKIAPFPTEKKISLYVYPCLIFVLIFAGGLLLFNYHFSILKIGREPLLKLHSYLYIIVAFMVSWGNALLIAGLCYRLIELRLIKLPLLFYLLILEGALTSISMGSRAQMILHTLIPFVIYFFLREKFKSQINNKEWFKIIIFTFFAISTAVFVVSSDRVKEFTSAIPIKNEQKVSIESKITFHSHDNSFKKTQMKELPSYENTQRFAPLITKTTPPISSQLAWVWMFGQLNKLFVDRWIGVEGVLAVSSYQKLDKVLFYKGLTENPQKGNDAIYQKLSKSPYKKLQNFTFLTIPGPIAFLYYSGNLYWVALGVSALFFLGCIIELITNIFIKNTAVSSVTGMALAYLMVQINFPKTLFYFIIELIAFLIFIGLLELIIKKLQRSHLVGINYLQQHVARY